MFIQATTLKPGTSIEADICIIGAGAAGITLARSLRDSGKSVCMLESGDLQGLPKGETDPLYEISSEGLDIAHDSRRRVFGGTTTIWSGRWKTPDKIDFELRPWIPNSGWPLSFESLEPYYRRACDLMHAPDVLVEREAPRTPRLPDFEAIAFPTQTGDWLDWGKAYAQEFETDETSVFLDAHVTKLEKASGRISRVSVRSQQSEFTVSATAFILACGGIENARQLLISDIGNEHDQVGRYFMEHPKGITGRIKSLVHDPSGYWDRPKPNTGFFGFRLVDDIQRKEQILNSHFFLEPIYESILSRIGKKLRYRRTSRVAVRTYMEQPPDPENRIVLSSKHDIYGLPQAHSINRPGDMETKTIRAMHTHLQAAVKESGFGELESPVLRGKIPKLVDASHHMGTTRMGLDPQCSVVDQNCKVHNVENLYIAGSSVFPTSGYANPMATICALAVRLAGNLNSL